jgi:hypothetical protein
MRASLVIIIISTFLASCSSVSSTNFAAKEQTCVRACSANYSSCASGTISQLAIHACQDAMSICANTCPEK